jgi:hypothetical protein
MHLNEEQVQRMLGGELPPVAEAVLEEHVAGCPKCRDRVAAAERDQREVHALLGVVDHPPPRLDYSVLVAGAARRDAARRRWAAGILLALGLTGAAYAAPGSPLRSWLATVLDRVGPGGSGGSSDPSVSVIKAVPDPVQPAEAGAGIAVTPGPSLLIEISRPPGGGQASVSLTDGPQVVVKAPSGSASFTSEVDRLLVEPKDSSVTLEIEIPRTAPRVEIRVGPDRVFLKDGPRLSTTGAMEGEGRYLIRLLR